MTTDSARERLRADDPREIAGYRLLGRIGEGGMGTVYLSRTRGGQPVALKVIRREYGGDPDFRRRFEQEVRAARRVAGYHVVPVLDHDTTGEQPWLASEFVPGLALHEALAAYGPLPLTSVLQLVGCTARALGAIHTAGVVHRDLKPSNILLSDQGPYVIDFGIARAADATQLTASGGVVGTPQFMSPEHALGEAVGPAADVFSLGLIAAVAATGRHPFGDGGALTLAVQIANAAVRPPRLDAYDDRLRPLLERCLAADPDARVGTDELAALCEQAAGRPLNDFTDWLPRPLSARLSARRSAVDSAAPEPTVADAPPPPPPHSPTFAGAPTVAPSAPEGSSDPHGPRSAPSRAIVAATAVALVLAGVLTWTVTRSDSTLDDGRGRGDDREAAQPTRSAGPGAAASPSASESGSDSGTDAGSGSDGPDGSGGPGYVVVFRDRPLSLRAPSGVNIMRVDLDIPQVVQDTSGREIMLSEISGGRWEFYTPMGKSAGKTPEQCLQGARADVLPNEIEAEELRTTIPVGTLLCTVTTDDRLAMLEVTGITGSQDGLPDYTTRLTLWEPR
ncbi:protein kinase domain-containing protein [Streptomyces tritici]|uniref:protein kinase domain-containing protein n=1 Tax=Streptomyces tritici TaxID=2054410 RepID=UPI003AF0C5FA